jgi:hypothetical protein
MISLKRMKESIKRSNEEYNKYWEGRKPYEHPEGETRPFMHPFGDYVPSTSFQRLQFRADGLKGINPNYYVENVFHPNWQKQQKIYDSHNKWRFIIENVYKVPAENFDQFREMYVKYRVPMLDCKNYFSSLIKGRAHFYSETGQVMSPNLVELEKKKLFYF